jgi:ribosome-binding factor A
METTRQHKIARLLQKELSEIFLLEAKNVMPGVLITVSEVRVSPDLGVAKVYLSIFPTNITDQVMEVIEKQKGKFRYELGTRVRHQLRKVPELAFFADATLDYLENIDKLLNND